MAPTNEQTAGLALHRCRGGKLAGGTWSEVAEPELAHSRRPTHAKLRKLQVGLEFPSSTVTSQNGPPVCVCVCVNMCGAYACTELAWSGRWPKRAPLYIPYVRTLGPARPRRSGSRSCPPLAATWAARAARAARGPPQWPRAASPQGSSQRVRQSVRAGGCPGGGRCPGRRATHGTISGGQLGEVARRQGSLPQGAEGGRPGRWRGEGGGEARRLWPPAGDAALCEVAARPTFKRRPAARPTSQRRPAAGDLRPRGGLFEREQ
eukprot:scaffold34815_cov63-Phaeocystis_antarctica.AAC.8